MKSISLFEDKHSFLNGLCPKTKLAYVVCALGVPFLVGGMPMYLLFIITSLILLATSHVLGKIKIVIKVTGFIILTIFIVQTFFDRAIIPCCLRLVLWLRAKKDLNLRWVLY